MAPEEHRLVTDKENTRTIFAVFGGFRPYARSTVTRVGPWDSLTISYDQFSTNGNTRRKIFLRDLRYEKTTNAVRECHADKCISYVCRITRINDFQRRTTANYLSD